MGKQYSIPIYIVNERHIWWRSVPNDHDFERLTTLACPVKARFRASMVIANIVCDQHLKLAAYKEL
jgi:hypothetical protein